MTPSPPAPSFAERGDEKIDFKELTQGRYSLRKFDPRPIEEEKLRLLLQAAQSAPTAHNNQPQHVLVCRSPGALERVNRCTSMHFGAPVVLVVCYDESPLLITWTRKTLSSRFWEDWISVVSIFSVPELKFTAASRDSQRMRPSMSERSRISK